VVAVDDSKSGAAYTGIEIASDGGKNFLHVANFSAGKIDVYDSTWAEVEKPFKDPFIPSGYSPFNIRLIGNWLYVMYAKVGPDGREAKEAGAGFVDIFRKQTALQMPRWFCQEEHSMRRGGLQRRPMHFGT
jgi:uncharacterized protein (TIGR03118 family)